MEKSLSSRSDSNSTAASTNRSLRLRARSIALRSDRSTLSRCQLGTYCSAGSSPTGLRSAVFGRGMAPRSLVVDFSQEGTDDLLKPIGALVVYGVCRAVEFYVACQRIDFGEPAPLSPPRRLVEGAGHQQHRTPDTTEGFRRKLGAIDAVFMQRADKLTPVLGSVVGVVQVAQRVRPGAVQVLKARSPVVARAARPGTYQHKRSRRAGR